MGHLGAVVQEIFAPAEAGPSTAPAPVAAKPVVAGSAKKRKRREAAAKKEKKPKQRIEPTDAQIAAIVDRMGEVVHDQPGAYFGAQMPKQPLSWRPDDDLNWARCGKS